MDRLKDLLVEDEEFESKQPDGESFTEETEVEVYAFSIEEALKTAADALKTSIANLQYEVLERGSPGFLGIGKKPFKYLVRATGRAEGLSLTPETIKRELVEPQFAVDKDGSFRILVKKEGIFIKVDPPQGKGKKINLQTIQHQLMLKDIAKYDENVVKQEVERPSSRYKKIGEYTPSQYDSHFQLQISPDEMKAYVTMTKPEKYGRVVDTEEVFAALKAKNVTYGIKKDAIENAIENELFNIPIVVAEGDMPVDGKDAQIKYHFKTSTDEVKFEVAEDGSVDFHKLDLIQSVVVGQVLATKIPSEKGKAGRTITGKIIPARDGKDVKLNFGNNTHLSPDGMQVISDINGQVIFKNNKIQVEPVYEVSGDVDLTTGDINFPGNVIIYGNVNDTFKVYSGANIEIKGNIGKASVVAEGNIIVRQGIQGKDEARIVSAGDVYAKFIERANVKAEGYVVVTEVILHSNVESKKKIICQGGKRSQIAGGRVRALYEINAKYLGAEAYTETILEAGIDPEAEDKIMEIHKRKEVIQKEWPEITQELSNLTMMLGRGALPPDMQEKYNLLTLKNNELRQEMTALDEQLKSLQEYLDTIGKDAKISASKTVYPGVKIKIKNDALAIKSEYKFVTFYREGGLVKIAPYEKSKEMEEKIKGLTKTRNI